MKNSEPIMEVLAKPASSNQFVIDTYQRRYSWKAKQINEFINTLNYPSGETYPIGMVTVFESKGKGRGDIEIVDGQQRIITIWMFLCAIRDIAKHLADNATVLVLQRYIERVNDKTQTISTKPLIRTMRDVNDQNAIMAIYHGKLASGNKGKVADNYRLIKRYINCDNYKDVLDKLRGLTVIYAECETKEEAMQSFIALNTFGVNMHSGDVIPTVLYMHCNRLTNPAKEECCDMISTIKGRFEGWTNNAREGFYGRYLFLKTNKYILPSGLADAFDRLLSASSIHITDVLIELLNLLDFEEEFVSGRNKLSDKTKRELSVMEKDDRLMLVADTLFSPQSPYYTKMGEEAEKLEILKTWERFLVLRYHSSGNYSHIDRTCPLFKTALNIAESEHISISEAFRKNLIVLSKTSREFKLNSRDDIKESIINKYSLAGITLRRLNFLRTKDDLTLSYDGATKEHIMPQHGNESNKLLNTIGNLTLLSVGHNSRLKNVDFSLKKPTLVKSQLGLNRYFINIDKWDDEEIRKRSELLAEEALSYYWLE